jgi:hypothetical protein
MDPSKLLKGGLVSLVEAVEFLEEFGLGLSMLKMKLNMEKTMKDWVCVKDVSINTIQFCVLFR